MTKERETGEHFEEMEGKGDIGDYTHGKVIPEGKKEGVTLSTTEIALEPKTAKTESSQTCRTICTTRNGKELIRSDYPSLRGTGARRN